VNINAVEAIADAVLYEGYVLYPYRPSALKNRRRFNFGVLVPKPAEGTSESGDAWEMCSECLATASIESLLSAKVRFLHLVERRVGKISPSIAELPDGTVPDFEVVESVQVGGNFYQTWQEASERQVSVEATIHEILSSPSIAAFSFPASSHIEALHEADGRAAGLLFRDQRAIGGKIALSATQIGDRTFRISIRVKNLSRVENAGGESREDLLNRSLVSTHAILAIANGQFVSLLDPPFELAAETAACRNSGFWPVLVGEAGERNMMLISPIILYDHPQIAPESAGDLCDGTEIDEILALRILTMTDQEKQEARGSDDRARRILERTESLPEEHFMKLHGVLRNVRRVTGD